MIRGRSETAETSNKEETKSLKWFSEYIESQNQDLVNSKLRSYYLYDKDGKICDLSNILDHSKSEPKECLFKAQDMSRYENSKFSSPQVPKRQTITSAFKSSNEKEVIRKIENPFRKLLENRAGSKFS